MKPESSHRQAITVQRWIDPGRRRQGRPDALVLLERSNRRASSLTAFETSTAPTS